jgi:hypothetical protein
MSWFLQRSKKLALLGQGEYFEMFIIIQIKPMSRALKAGKLGFLLAVFFLAVFLSSDAVFAHPGNTAADGCHYCRTNCDKWGVPWNERHCHGGSSIPTPAPTPKPVYSPAPEPKPVPVPIFVSPKSTDAATTNATIDGKIRGKINEVKNDYSKNHDGFRERLINDIKNMLGSDADINKIGYYVYTMLPDIKGMGPETYVCNCAKTCPEISTCEEAQYQLNTCGCTVRDADHDGIACDADCQ